MTVIPNMSEDASALITKWKLMRVTKGSANINFEIYIFNYRILFHTDALAEQVNLGRQLFPQLAVMRSLSMLIGNIFVLKA